MRQATITAVASTVLSLIGSGAWAADAQAPTIRHVPVADATFGRPVIIRAEIEDRSGIFAPAVFVRARGERRYVSIPMKRVGDGFEATIPAELLAGDIEYFVEAFDEHGNGPSRRGAPDAPLRMRVSRTTQASTRVLVPPVVTSTGGSSAEASIVVAKSDDDGGVFSSWWFWTLVGVVAVGAAAGAAVALTSDPSVDAVSIEVRGPDPAGGPP